MIYALRVEADMPGVYGTAKADEVHTAKFTIPPDHPLVQQIMDYHNEQIRLQVMNSATQGEMPIF